MDSYKTITPESLKTSGRILFHARTTSVSDERGILPVKSEAIYIMAIATINNAANLTLTVKTADDADGLNSTDLIQNIPVFVNDVKQTASKSYTITDDFGNFAVLFCVPTIIIPTNKYVGLNYGISHVSNVVSAIALEDTLYNG